MFDTGAIASLSEKRARVTGGVNAKTISPKSQQRLRVMDVYRGRGHRNSNLWLGYSEKLDQDCIVTNDRELVHWIVFLEIDPTVKRFECAPQGADTDFRGNDRTVGVNHRLIDSYRKMHRARAGVASS